MGKTLKRSSFTNAAAIAKRVATNWAINHADYTVDFISYDTLATKAAQLKTLNGDSSIKTAKKAENTAALRAINREFELAVQLLRKMLKTTSPNQDIDAIYRSYGMEKPVPKLPKTKAQTADKKEEKAGAEADNKDAKIAKKRSYEPPTSNNHRIALATQIIIKLAEDNNLLKHSIQGWEYWTKLRNRHLLAWENSGEMRASKSVLSGQAQQLRTEVLAALARLKKRVRMDFEGEDINKTLRTFGFLEESL